MSFAQVSPDCNKSSQIWIIFSLLPCAANSVLQYIMQNALTCVSFSKLWQNVLGRHFDPYFSFRVAKNVTFREKVRCTLERCLWHNLKTFDIKEQTLARHQLSSFFSYTFTILQGVNYSNFSINIQKPIGFPREGVKNCYIMVTLTAYG